MSFGERRAAAIPDPITTAARNAEPRNSASRLRRKVALILKASNGREGVAVLAGQTVACCAVGEREDVRADGDVVVAVEDRVGARSDRLRRACRLELFNERGEHLAQPPLVR